MNYQEEVNKAMKLLCTLAPAVHAMPIDKALKLLHSNLSPDEIKHLKCFLDLMIQALDEILVEETENIETGDFDPDTQSVH